MTIPANLTHAEVGAFLIAIGQHMLDHNVCAEAVIQPELIQDDLDYATNLAEVMHNVNEYEDMPEERCLEILNNLTLPEAISFIHPAFLKPKA
jgi:hypothetical protein